MCEPICSVAITGTDWGPGSQNEGVSSFEVTLVAPMSHVALLLMF